MVGWACNALATSDAGSTPAKSTNERVAWGYMKIYLPNDPIEIGIEMEDYGKRYTCSPNKREEIPRCAEAIMEKFLRMKLGADYETRLPSKASWVNKKSIHEKFTEELYRQWDAVFSPEDDCLNC